MEIFSAAVYQEVVPCVHGSCLDESGLSHQQAVSIAAQPRNWLSCSHVRCITRRARQHRTATRTDNSHGQGRDRGAEASSTQAQGYLLAEPAEPFLACLVCLALSQVAEHRARGFRGLQEMEFDFKI